MKSRYLTFILFGCFIAARLNSSIATAQTGGDGFLSANAVAQSYFQRRLLEFVAPVYQQPLISSSLIESLSRPGPNATPDQKLAADKIAFAGSAATQVEAQTRMLELALRQQTMQRNGMVVGGARSTIQAGGLAARSLALQSKVQVLRDQLALENEKHKFLVESNKEQLAYRLEKIKRQPNTGLNARSGFPLNIILESIKPTILHYGYGIGESSSFSVELKELTIDSDDIAKVQLQLEVEGPPVIFTADKGSAQLGQLPFVMNHPALVPLIKDIESKIANIAKLEPGPEFYTKTVQLSTAVQKLETTSDQVIGTAKECAQRGSKDYQLWRIGKDYRSRMRGIVNRLELEGSPKSLTTAAKKFDPSESGNTVLAFARFIAENNCKIAPAAQGDESVYVRLLSSLTQLQEILRN